MGCIFDDCEREPVQTKQDLVVMKNKLDELARQVVVLKRSEAERLLKALWQLPAFKENYELVTLLQSKLV